LDPVFILGCGYTGGRVARLLLDQGIAVGGSARSLDSLAPLASQGLRAVAFDAAAPQDLPRLAAQLEPGTRLLYSIPTLTAPDGRRWEPARQILDAIGDRLSRVVYLSTTGVYGSTPVVDENTSPKPETERQRLRVEAERAVLSGPWKSLILRPAAIYGPGRGVQAALPEGTYKLAGDGANFVSRIHVDDLAAISTAALLSGLTGAYPAADEEPCSSREIADFCAALLGLGPVESVTSDELSETRRSDRRVDGRAILSLLGLTLRYPSYRQGIPASLG
jgi:nucleoside-diphosphate-sugar epimerase